jgi:zinc protease
MLAWHTPRGLDKATFPLDVMAKVLGGQSKSSRLYKALVETGLASECYAYNYSLYDPGLFIVSATVQPGIAPSTVEAKLKEEVKEFGKNLVSADELDLAKVSLDKRFRLSLSDGMNLAQSITEGIALGDWRFWANYPKTILTVTSKAVKEQAEKTFSDRNLSCGYYLPVDFKAEGLTTGTVAVGHENSGPSLNRSVNVRTDDSSRPDGPFAKEEKATQLASKPASPVAGAVIGGAVKGIAGRVERFVLANGLTFLLCPSNSTPFASQLPGTVALSAKIRAGDYFAPVGRPALPELTAQMLPFATRSFKKEVLANKLEKLGISLDLDSGSFFQDFGAEVSVEDLPQLLTITASLLLEPDFSLDNLDLVKKLTLAALQEKSTDTGEVAWNALLNDLYKPGFVYHAPPFAKQMEEVKSISLDEIKQYHRRQYIAPNMVICLIGDFDKQTLKKELKEKFAAIPSGNRSQITLECDGLTDKYLALKGRAEIKSPLTDKANIDVSIGKPVELSFKSKDYLPALIGNAVLGYDSFACRLAPLRDQYGLTYSVASRISQPQFPYSPWSIDYSVNPENLARSQQILNQLVNTFQKGGVSQAEVNKEKRHLAGTFLVGLRNIQAIAGKLCEYEQIGLPLTNIDDFAQRLEKINVENVNKAIKKYFQLDRTVSSMAGSFKATQSPKPTDKKVVVP